MMCVVYGVCCGKQEVNKSRLNIGHISPSSVCACAGVNGLRLSADGGGGRASAFTQGDKGETFQGC